MRALKPSILKTAKPDGVKPSPAIFLCFTAATLGFGSVPR